MIDCFESMNASDASLAWQLRASPWSVGRFYADPSNNLSRGAELGQNTNGDREGSDEQLWVLADEDKGHLRLAVGILDRRL